ncbi:ABC transporter substrate-binding protein, partial [Patescibacteria group bacterium]
PKNIVEIKKDKSFLKTYLLPRVFAVFFNQDDATVFTEKEVREALSLSVDRKKIIDNVLENFGTELVGPIPPGSLGSTQTNSMTKDKSYEDNLEEAIQLLNKKGWKMDEEEGVLIKKKGKSLTKLEFSLSTSDVADLVQTAYLLQDMWEKIGARVEIKIYEIGDLEQNVIRPRKYNALLFGEIMGRDPDPFAFWHSSQRNDPGLNIALYTSITADKLLESARTIFDTQEREEKYRKFQEEVISDNPAVFLYSPYFIHLLPQDIKGISEISITTPSERFSQVYNWYIKTQKIWKIFLEK